MLRLTCIRARSHEVTLQAEGQIVAEWVALLEEECRELLEQDHHVSLDLGKVSYLDQRAVKMLHDLAGKPVSIVNCSPLVAELLREDAP
jgi:anti-anti-sigma regulatory factor